MEDVIRIKVITSWHFVCHCDMAMLCDLAFQQLTYAKLARGDSILMNYVWFKISFLKLVAQIFEGTQSLDIELSSIDLNVSVCRTTKFR
jgi:hypothetical protein